MSLVPFEKPASPIKHPICPQCRVPMRLESGVPDARYSNLRHWMFRCDACNITTDQLLADPP